MISGSDIYYAGVSGTVKILPIHSQPQTYRAFSSCSTSQVSMLLFRPACLVKLALVDDAPGIRDGL